MITFPKAKINLGLQIKFKRDDGFHEIETCLYPIELCDILEIQASDEISFKTSGLDLKVDLKDQLCFKAFNIFENNGLGRDINLHLHKVIPHGAGLGGGSSDASYTLKMINDLFELGFNQSELQNFSGDLGSDCPFFITENPCIAKGRGEILNSINISLADYHILIIHPGFGISTAEAYSSISPKTPAYELSEILSKDISYWKDELKNDFQEVLEVKYPSLREIRLELYKKGAIYSAMSGSGSAYFGIFQEELNLNDLDLPGNYFKWTGKLK